MRPSRYFSHAAGFQISTHTAAPTICTSAARLHAKELAKTLGNHQPPAAG